MHNNNNNNNNNNSIKNSKKIINQYFRYEIIYKFYFAEQTFVLFLYERLKVLFQIFYLVLEIHNLFH